ncbi:energy-coupling factor transporter ATPase [Mycoplasmatota bacterium]|nr:energy-coupling factor transporter ATPase [Mycoplasmatota bacterium]
MGIQFEKVNFRYAEGSVREHAALIDIDLNIELGSYVAVIGHTGSGKSTLIQHMNALLLPNSGTINIFDKKVIGGKKNKGINSIRKRVGLVFQFPEYQLFEETVEKDIMFGPMNFGVSKDEASKKAHEVINLVGLDDEFLTRSPLNLSGGQMRRVAIAGILAMDPQVLVLDEPTAGLDPSGQKEMMEMFNNLYENHQKTIILITHDMNYVAQYAKRVIVMDHGKLVFDGKPMELFSQKDLLTKYQLDFPDITKMIYHIENKLGITLDKKIKTVDELSQAIVEAIGGEPHVR